MRGRRLAQYCGPRRSHFDQYVILVPTVWELFGSHFIADQCCFPINIQHILPVLVKVVDVNQIGKKAILGWRAIGLSFHRQGMGGGASAWWYNLFQHQGQFSLEGITPSTTTNSSTSRLIVEDTGLLGIQCQDSSRYNIPPTAIAFQDSCHSRQLAAAESYSSR